MKTTLDISEPLLKEACKTDAREGMTLRALVEQGLRHILAEKKSRKPFKMRDARVGGGGLRPELRDATWEEILDIIYEGRGT
jgi:hypothetical protein